MVPRPAAEALAMTLALEQHLAAAPPADAEAADETQVGAEAAAEATAEATAEAAVAADAENAADADDEEDAEDEAGPEDQEGAEGEEECDKVDRRSIAWKRRAGKAAGKAKPNPKLKANAKKQDKLAGAAKPKAKGKAKAKAKAKEKADAKLKTEQPDDEGGAAAEPGETTAGDAQGNVVMDRATWMRFHRSLQSTTSRQAKTSKCPDDIRAAIADDPMKHSYYLQLWHASDQSWGSVVAYERKFSTNTAGTKFVQEWLTAGQLQDIYKDKKVVQAIKDKKGMIAIPQ